MRKDVTVFGTRDLFDDFINEFLGINTTLQTLDEFFQLYDFRPDVPRYPVSNWWIGKDGTSVFEFAFTGVDKADIKVEVVNQVLTVTSKPRQSEIKGSEGYFVYRNISKKEASVSIRLSDRQDVDKITTSYKDGLLTVTIPLKEEVKPTRKEISIG